MMKRCELVFEATRRGGCKEHPYDTQSPGVCSSCLREKLSQLYHTNPIIIDPPSLSSPTLISSPHRNFSSKHRRPRFRRNGSHVAAESASSVLMSLNLKKSNSVAFGSVMSGSGRKKDGFWKKVLKLKTKDIRESLLITSTSTRKEP